MSTFTEQAASALYVPCTADVSKRRVVQGLILDENSKVSVTVDELFKGLKSSGFQASKLATAAEIVESMLEARRQGPDGCRIWLSFTSNLISSGLREVFVFLAKHKLVDVIVTTAGGVEEDLIKCLGPTYLGEFEMNGPELRSKGLNRIGNLLSPNDNYCKFEDWLKPILAELLDRQNYRLKQRIEECEKESLGLHTSKVEFLLRQVAAETTQSHQLIHEKINECLLEINNRNKKMPKQAVKNTTGDPSTNYDLKGVCMTPSELIRYLGEKINDESSLLYWCSKNDIPIFSPAITDGSLGDSIFFHTYHTAPQDGNGDIKEKNTMDSNDDSIFSFETLMSRGSGGLVLDVSRDIRKINDLALGSKKSGIILLGGGLAKHHVLNANLMRNGADYAVYINTAQEFDGSDSGGSPDEAVSWGKIKPPTLSNSSTTQNDSSLVYEGLPAKPNKVKVVVDATIAFPLLVAQTFYKYVRSTEK